MLITENRGLNLLVSGSYVGVISSMDVGKSGRYFFQHLDTDLAGRDFAQCRHGWLVLGVHFRGVTLQQLTCAISRSQSQLKAVRDLLEAIFNRDTGHKYS